MAQQKIRSKKGQGLGFVAVIIMIALLYFVFRYNTEAYEFVMAAGQQQAHLVTSYVETEKAKFFSETAMEQAAYETAWKFGAANCSNFTAKICSKKDDFIENTTVIFYEYLARYSPGVIDLDTYFPDYRFRINKCDKNGMEIEAFGFDESCWLRPDYPFPESACLDQENSEDCQAVKFTDKKTGACKWNDTGKANTSYCYETKPAPDCESIINSANCTAKKDLFNKAACYWETSYAENINILSISLSNYQFGIDSDAHFIENIDCKGYDAFVATRKNIQAFRPVCSVKVEPLTGNTTDTFIFTITYKGETEPTLNFGILNSTGSEIKKPKLDETDSTDKIYLDGKTYTAGSLFASAGKYTAKISCKDTYGRTDDDSKSFTVT